MVEVQGRKSVVRCRKERKWVGGFIKLLEIGEPEQLSKRDPEVVQLNPQSVTIFPAMDLTNVDENLLFFVFLRNGIRSASGEIGEPKK